METQDRKKMPTRNSRWKENVQFPKKALFDIIFLSSDLNGERKQCKFICGDAEELHKKDDEWAEKLEVSRDPET